MPNTNLIFDVGMHRGEDTDFYLAKGFKVIAFEADPDLVKQAKTRFKDQLDTGRLVILEGAIVPDNFGEKVCFFKNKKSTVWGTVVKEWAQRNKSLGADSEIIEVDTIDFSECLEKYGVPHYLKIDIEGMDLTCCESLFSHADRPTYLSIESEKVDFSKLVHEFDVLDRLGYDAFKLIQQSGISRQKEPNPSRENKFVGYKFIEGSSGLFGSDLPGDWLDKDAAIKQYVKVFSQYRLFGNRSFLRKIPLSRYFFGALRRMRVPLPGWYDTHARHRNAS